MIFAARSRVSRITGGEDRTDPEKILALSAVFTLWGLLIPAAALPSTEEEGDLERVTVTATGIASPLRDLAGNNARIDGEVIELTGQTHVSELMYWAPGAWITRGSGQESLTAIRSPLLTGPGACGAFLLLEDGIPTRPAGFCNVNDIFEINTEQAGNVEVVRGPGSALYGSNALHGSINVISPPAGSPAYAAMETGSWDYYRTRALGGSRIGDGDLQAWGHVEHDGGFRDSSGYDQAKGNAAWVSPAAGGMLRLAAAGTHLRQNTAGFISGEDSYKNADARRSNPTPDAYRDADSLRLSSVFDLMLNRRSTMQVRAFYRQSRMDFLQHFLPGTPVEKNGQDSGGVDFFYRRLTSGGGRFVIGSNLEYMSGFLKETQARPITEGSNMIIETRPAGRHYDFDVDSWRLAGFLHAEQPIGSRFRAAAGLRYGLIRYEYDNRMLDGNTRDDGTECGFGGCLYNRPADRKDDFEDWAPKLGLVYYLSDRAETYASLKRGFRFPQATELYRLQRQQNVADLEPETLDSLELGVRYRGDRLFLDVAAWHMRKRHVIFRDAQGINVSDGKTRHVGLEYLADWRIWPNLSATLRGAWARHTYRFDRAIGGGESISSGDDVDSAPRRINQATLRWDYSGGGTIELEWVAVGSYYMDAANTVKYDGHQVFNLRVQQRLSRHWQGAFRINNLNDKSYAERADFAFDNYRYLPGRDRAVFLEIRFLGN